MNLKSLIWRVFVVLLRALMQVPAALVAGRSLRVRRELWYFAAIASYARHGTACTLLLLACVLAYELV